MARCLASPAVALALMIPLFHPSSLSVFILYDSSFSLSLVSYRFGSSDQPSSVLDRGPISGPEVPHNSLDLLYINPSAAGSLGVPASPLRSTIDPPLLVVYVTSSRNDFVRRLALLMALARTSLAKAQKRNKLTYDRGVREKNNNLQPGSYVFVRIEEFLAGTSKKLHPQAHGPYRIVSHDGRTFLPHREPRW